jgi:2'-5' RNA ligase
MEEARLLTVMATPVEVPAMVDRSRWPVHVTIAGNFRVDGVHAPTVSARLMLVANDAAAFDVNLGPTAQFGTEHNIPVLLAEHPAFYRLHASLAIELKQLSGFTANDPSFWEDGYRPHASLGPAVNVGDGESLPIRWLTLVSLDASTGRRMSTIKLS